MSKKVEEIARDINRLKEAGLDGTYYWAVYNAIEQLERLIDDPNNLSAEKIDNAEKSISKIKQYHKDEIVAFQEEMVEIPLDIYGRRNDV